MKALDFFISKKKYGVLEKLVITNLKIEVFLGFFK